MRKRADQAKFAEISLARGYQLLQLFSTIKQAFGVSSKASTASRTCIASNCRESAAMPRNKQNTEK